MIVTGEYWRSWRKSPRLIQMDCSLCDGITDYILVDDHVEPTGSAHRLR